MNAKQIERLRWRCRRGMLELDLVLTAFLDRHAASLASHEIAQLQQLLDCPDNDLWDMLMARKEPDDAACKPLLAMLQAVTS